MDSDNYIRGAAVETLGAMKVARAVPDLARMLDDTELKHPGKRICDLVLIALITIRTEDALDAAVDWCVQQLPNDTVRVEGKTLSRWASDMSLTGDGMTTLYRKRWNVEPYHKSLKQNASLEKSPTQTVTTQTNHLFASSLCLHQTRMVA